MFSKAAVARPDPLAPAQWLLMNRPDRGYAESSEGPYATLGAIADRYAVRIGAYGEDEHGLFACIEGA